LHSQDLITRALTGGAIAALIAAAALRTRVLSRSGAVTGFALGTITVAAGWSWALLLIGFFVAGSGFSTLGAEKKRSLLGSITAKGGHRDAAQVAANGALFAAAALGALFTGDARWQAIGIGALAAATADTWATEIGTLGARLPRLIISGRRVPTGTSGGVTLGGTAAGIAGALCAAAGARLAGWGVPFAAAVAGGIAGLLADSLLGATLQCRRWCEACHMPTERPVHNCGIGTRHAGGIAALDNDGVNFVATLSGGMVGLLVMTLLTALK
jgi:uncharacterized protein (TIGR00297 family)